jgi:uncharacterized RDD family membrane protein YckC
VRQDRVISRRAFQLKAQATVMTTPGQPDPWDLPQTGQPPFGYPYPQAQPNYGQYPQGPHGSPQQAGYGYPGGPPYASWSKRVGAYLIDGVIGLALSVLFLPLLVSYADTQQVQPNGRVQTIGSVSGGSVGIAIVGGCVLLGYTILQWYLEGRLGWTIGKRALGIRLVRERDGRFVGFWLALVRYLIYLVIGSICFIASILNYLWPLWDPKRQTWPDKLLGQLVIEAYGVPVEERGQPGE